MLTINLNSVNWANIDDVGQIDVHVPAQMTGLQESVEGTLNISQKGYVYCLSSKPVLWLKFLGLTTYLSLSGTAAKCKHIAMQIFHRPISEKETQDLKHIFRLATISGDAVIGKGRKSITERVEEFALAEIDYNNSDRQDEMNYPRSIRLKSGVYVAKCMQPLFHKDQTQVPIDLSRSILELESQKRSLQTELRDRATRSVAYSFFDYFSIISYPYANLSDSQIEESIRNADALLLAKTRQMESASRCTKYAAMAILRQQGYLTLCAKDALVETTAEVECCDIMCYKEQKICGLLYKIECCAERCWAIDCFCCVCCFWPAGRSVSVLI